MKIRYFKRDTDYIAVTSESPRGFEKTLYVGKQAKPNRGPESIYETAFTANQFTEWEEVAKSDLPLEWLTAFGYEEPDPEPVPEPEPIPVKIVQDIPRDYELNIRLLPAGFYLPPTNQVSQRCADWVQLLIMLLGILFICIFGV